MHTRELERIKAFLSRQTDKARAAYGRRAQTVPRQFICAGTTNDREYMREDERRLLPIIVGKFDIDALRATSNSCGLRPHITRRKARQSPWPRASEARIKHLIANPLREVLHSKLGANQGWVAARTVWEILDVSTEKRLAVAPSMGKAMARLGFTKDQVRAGSDPRGDRGDWFYERGETPEARARKLCS